jgi:hypothetical protein
MGFRKGYGCGAAVFLLKKSIAHFICEPYITAKITGY